MSIERPINKMLLDRENTGYEISGLIPLGMQGDNVHQCIHLHRKQSPNPNGVDIKRN